MSAVREGAMKKKSLTKPLRSASRTSVFLPEAGPTPFVLRKCEVRQRSVTRPRPPRQACSWLGLGLGLGLGSEIGLGSGSGLGPGLGLGLAEAGLLGGAGGVPQRRRHHGVEGIGLPLTALAR